MKAEEKTRGLAKAGKNGTALNTNDYEKEFPEFQREE